MRQGERIHLLVSVNLTFGRAKGESITPCFLEKGVESDPFKLRVVKFLPKSHILDGILQAHPVLYNILWFLCIFFDERCL